MENSYKAIWRLALPIMGASLAQNAVSLIDTLFLGLLGRVPLAAGGIGVVIFLTIGFVGLGIGTGVQVLAAQLLGAGQAVSLGTLLRQALWMSGAVGLGLTFLVWQGSPVLLPLLLSHEATLTTTTLFLQGRSLELLPLMLFGALRGYYSGTGQTPYIFQANLLLALTNLALNALFVLGLGWGLYGVILGSVLAQYVATIYLFVCLPYQRYPLRQSAAGRWLRPLLRYAGPAVLQNLVGMTGWVVFFLLIERRGPVALASANIVRSIYSFVMLPAWAFSTAVGTLVGYFWGARQPAALRQTFQRAWRLTQGINTLLALGLAGSAPTLTSFFTTDAYIRQEAAQGLYMIAISIFLMPTSALLLSAVVAMGLVVAAFVVEVAIILVYVGYAVWLNSAGASLTWLWSAEWVYWVPSAIVLGWLALRRLYHLRQNLLASPHAAGTTVAGVA
ncbi:MAG: MATE family efflux transporter [Bacteroidia bacterium]|nr:MATE family efflux transporter [Bacteroidia bacterium]MDW8088184.1 MATE family efflux transporter [Bacteroidia bacterium]